MPTLVEPFQAACQYPGTLDVAAVESALATYLQALGLQRSVVRLEKGWTLAQHPPLQTQVADILGDIARLGSSAHCAGSSHRAIFEVRKIVTHHANQSARVAADAARTRDAQNCRQALTVRPLGDAHSVRRLNTTRAHLGTFPSAVNPAQRAWERTDAANDILATMAQLPPDQFARWLINPQGWWNWVGFDLAWFALTYMGACQTGTAAVAAWAKPLYNAFLNGACLLHWTNDALYWAAKPTLHTEPLPSGSPQPHCATGPALESDVEDLCAWHGIVVAPHVVTHPERITLGEIAATPNAEVRRVLIERYGYGRYLHDAGLSLVDACAANHSLTGLRSARLYHDAQNDLFLLDMRNSTPEPDGSVRRYVLSVDGDAYSGRAGRECLAAMASTWRTPSDYALYFETPEHYRPIAES